MNRTLQIQDRLTRMSSVFSETAINCIDAVFGKRCEIHIPWQIVEQLQGQFDKIMTIGCASNKFSAIACAGIQNDSLMSFLCEENVSSAYASDVLGEMLNTYIGMLSDNEEYSTSFGYLSQAVPVLYENGNSYLPFIWGIQGYLYHENHWVYMGYSIRENLDDAGVLPEA
ncbi:MAG: hypothetical protein GF344_15880 [Chitinivibrionales bacterium]|nr:hypothetical protein [Chitinivibrionales bacterium]MBD3358175.1 hypothetical protein [Chitinivibrionales bacterium]